MTTEELCLSNLICSSRKCWVSHGICVESSHAQKDPERHVYVSSGSHPLKESISRTMWFGKCLEAVECSASIYDNVRPKQHVRWISC